MNASQVLLRQELWRLKKLKQEKEGRVQQYTNTTKKNFKVFGEDKLPEKYDPKKPCCKCGSNEHTVLHRKELINEEANYILPERLHLVCDRCKFAWETLPLDM